MSVLAVATMLPASAMLSHVGAQGITTGAIGGLVTDSAGVPLSEVQIQVRNLATGYLIGSITRDNGRYLVPGLEAGGPYTVTARRIGFAAQTRENIFVSLTQTTRGHRGHDGRFLIHANGCRDDGARLGDRAHSDAQP
jgi:hypothetical protein